MPQQTNILTTHTGPVFLGLQSYSEAQSGFFFGRDEEILTLTKLVENNTLTIVFGKSGTGKTSLLNAGVFPRLRKDYCLPFRIRLEFNEDSPELITQIKNVLKTEIDKYGFKVESYPSTETLWEYFHKEPLWKSITPILIFDQFEEIFTLAKTSNHFGKEEFDLFWEELSDLIENSIPEKLKDQFLNHKEEVEYNYKKQKTKVLFAFREEYLPEFESITSRIPSIKLSRFRLLPMNGNQAYDVITKTWGSRINSSEADKIVTYFTNDPEKSKYTLSDIEPSLLSQVCAHIEKKRISEGGEKISAELLNKYPKELILRSIYDETMEESNAIFHDAALKPGEKQPSPMNDFVENKLITLDGYRTRYKLTESDQRLLPGIDILSRKYFLRLDDNAAELTHDVLTPMIKTDREKKGIDLAKIVATKKAWKRARRILLIASLLLIGIAAYFYYFANRSARAESQKLEDRNILLTDAINRKIDSLKNLSKLPAVNGSTSTSANGTDSVSFNKKINSLRDSIGMLFQINKLLNDSLLEKIKQLDALERERSICLADKNDLTIKMAELEKSMAACNNDLEKIKNESNRWKEMYNKKYEELKICQSKKPNPVPPGPIDPENDPTNPAALTDTSSLLLELSYTKTSIKSKPALKVPGNLTIFLIPDNRANQRIIREAKYYESNCNEIKLRNAAGIIEATNYKGKYLFSSVAPGRYLVKICTYYGDYKMVNKEKGKLARVIMELAPPIQ
jgi:hypothetical protein